MTGCTFAGFADGVQFDACANCSIYGNTFLFPLGRDSGSGSSLTNGWPDVGIVVQQIGGSTYWPTNFAIYNNTFNGLSGTSSPTNVLSQEMGDGLVQATVDGLTCYGNTVTNHGAEGINIQSLPGTPVHPCSIYNNNWRVKGSREKSSGQFAFFFSQFEG